MELKEALLKRRSVRKFTDEEVNDKDIDELMHAAMSGPSAMNKQPWVFYVIKNKNMLNEIKNASPYTNINGNIAIIVCGDLNKIIRPEVKDFWIEDCSAATENILLRAVDLGLGTVWCGVYPFPQPVKAVSELLKLKNNEIPLNIIWVGHPAVEPEPRDQYNTELIHVIK